jgi:hypothetical protein
MRLRPIQTHNAIHLTKTLPHGSDFLRLIHLPNSWVSLVLTPTIQLVECLDSLINYGGIIPI